MTQVRINGTGVDLVTRVHTYAQTASADVLAGTLLAVVNDLTARYGTWKTPRGDINRYQRLTGNLQETYDDNKPSLPVGMAASTWGCLPSFVSRYPNGSSKRYGYNGNSFICAVEFGKKDKSKIITRRRPKRRPQFQTLRRPGRDVYEGDI